MASAVLGAGADPGPGGSKKGMRSPVTWLIVLGIALAGGAYLLYRRSQNSQQAATATDTSSTADQTDYAGQIATLQEEIMNLQSTEAQEDAGGGTTTPPPAGGGTTTPPPAGGGTTTPPPAAKPKVPAMPTSVHGTASGARSIHLTWNNVSGATAYKVRVTYQGKLAAQENLSHPYANVGGLTPDHTYTAHVAACNAAGCSPETNGPAVKTPRGA